LALAYLRYLLSISSISSISRYKIEVGKGEKVGEGKGAGARSLGGRSRKKGKKGYILTKKPRRYAT
jgi:hypothetical protein